MDAAVKNLTRTQALGVLWSRTPAHLRKVIRGVRFIVLNDGASVAIHTLNLEQIVSVLESYHE